MRRIGIDTPPTDEKARWERGLDPWHVDAAPDEFKANKVWERGPRRGGWLELDHWGNVIGWIPDGTEAE